jgi:hypothetical protein
LCLFWGWGSAISPVLINLSLGRFNKGLIVIWWAAILFFIMAIFLLFLRIKPHEVHKLNSIIPQPEDSLKQVYLTSMKCHFVPFDLASPIYRILPLNTPQLAAGMKAGCFPSLGRGN